MASLTTLERLQVLQAVAAHGTIAGAARSLGYTASAVSQHLATLEREANASLVERSNRGVVLTSAGHVLTERSSDILDLVRNAFDEVGATTNRHVTSLVVAAFPTAIRSMLLPVRSQLDLSINLTIIDAEPEAALRLLAAREIDGAITDGYTEDLSSRPDRLHRTLLHRDPIRLVACVEQMGTELSDYEDADWVLGGATSRLGQAARQYCRMAGFDPKVLAETDDHQVTFDVMQCTGAVSMLPELALADLPDGLAVADQIDPVFVRRIEFVTRRSLEDNPAVVAITSLLLEQAETRFNVHS